MQRRSFLTLLGGTAAAWSVAARAQRPVMPVIGYLDSGPSDRTSDNIKAFHRGLAETGYVEGRNLAIEYRWADDHYDRLPAMAEVLVCRQVAVIVAQTTPAALAAKAATRSIPIVFNIGTDPVEVGLVPSLNRPGGNVTGISSLIRATSAKRLELLHELIPTASIAFLVNPTNLVFAEPETRELQVAAQTLGVRLLILNASNPSEFEAAFARFIAEGAGGLIIGSDTLFWDYPERLAALATRYSVPAIHYRREFIAAGGLLNYGTDLPETRRVAGGYAGRILKGEKPADLPVQQVTKMQLAINMKTAKALGLTFPLTLLGRADEVIE
jgi:putative ABC transport system substrate-binding protein